MAHEWEPEGYFRMFISHLAKHKKEAKEISEWLKEYGIAGFVAHTSIKATNIWRAEILSSLKSMDGMLVLLHPEFHRSRFCDQEVGFALGAKKVVIPMTMGADPHGFLSAIQAVHGVGRNSRELCEEIVKALGSKKRSRDAIAKGIIRMLAESDTYDSAFRHIKLINAIPKAGAEAADMLEATPKKNSQVEDCGHGAGKRLIASIVERWRK